MHVLVAVCFSCGSFLGPVRCPQVLRWSLNGSGGNRKVETVRQLISCLSHPFGYVFGVLEAKKALGRLFSCVSFSWKFYNSVTHFPPLYGAICDIDCMCQFKSNLKCLVFHLAI